MVPIKVNAPFISFKKPSFTRCYLGLIGVWMIVSFGSCTKQSEDILVPDNAPPPDNTVSTVVMDNYINKVYIHLLGREPSDSELQADKNLLNGNNLNQKDREKMVSNLLKKPDYPQRLFDIAREDLLNGTDTSEITESIYLFLFLLTDSTYEQSFDLFHQEIDRLIALRIAPDQLASGSIDLIEVHRRFVNNFLYDQINMGTENFVVSMFQNFLFRYPTTEELEQASQITDGLGGILFLEEGESKSDFLDLFFGSANYYEGQIRDLYLRYYFREPTTAELQQLTNQYQEEGDFGAIQIHLLTTDEYVGI